VLDYELALFSNKGKDGAPHVAGATLIRKGVLDAFAEGSCFERLLLVLRTNGKQQEQKVEELEKKQSEEQEQQMQELVAQVEKKEGAKERQQAEELRKSLKRKQAGKKQRLGKWLLPQADLERWLGSTALILQPFVLLRYSSYLSLRIRLDAVQLAMRQIELAQLDELRLQESNLAAVLEGLLQLLDTSPNEIFRSDETSRHRGHGGHHEEKTEEKTEEEGETGRENNEHGSVDRSNDDEVGNLLGEQETLPRGGQETSPQSADDVQLELELEALKDKIIAIWRRICLDAFNSEHFKLRLFGVTQLLPIVKSSWMPPTAKDWLSDERVIEGIFGACL
jgi:hypothetical protein